MSGDDTSAPFDDLQGAESVAEPKRGLGRGADYMVDRGVKRRGLRRLCRATGNFFLMMAA